jgi:hypothetical protein
MLEIIETGVKARRFVYCVLISVIVLAGLFTAEDIILAIAQWQRSLSPDVCLPIDGSPQKTP